MKHNRGEAEHALAVFIDFENLALGFQGRRDRFEIEKVLERLVEKGKIVVKKAYSDWSRFGQYTGPLHEAAIELIEIPKRNLTGKNSADIRLVVDAIDLAYSKDHIDTFVIVSGDSDFSPLVSKLKELGKHVLGVGLANATSNLLRDNCDEFIYYEDLGRAPSGPIAGTDQLPEQQQKLYNLLMDSLHALRRENKDVIYSSMVKDTMKRKKPSFNEEFHGYRTFSELLEDAQKNGLLDLETSKQSGTYVVTRFGTEPKIARRTEAEKEEARTVRRRRRRGGSGRRREESAADDAPPATPTAPDPDIETIPTYALRKSTTEVTKVEPPPKRLMVEPAKVEPVKAEPAPRRPAVEPVKPDAPARKPRQPKLTDDGFGAGLEIE